MYPSPSAIENLEEDLIAVDPLSQDIYLLGIMIDLSFKVKSDFS